MTTPATEIRERLKKALHDARAHELAQGRRDAAGSGLVRLLGQLLVGASGPGGAPVHDGAAGYGSEVTVEDLDTGEWFRHRLMSAEGLDLEAGHVTTDSPLGGALLGRRAGDVVEVETPRGTRRLCIARVETLPAFLDWLQRTSRSASVRAPAGEAREARQPRTGTDG